MSPARRLADRHPFEIYLLAWTFIVSAPASLGLVHVPGSVSEQLPEFAGRAWATGLAIGSATALIGLAWKRPTFPRLSVTGLLLEQVGLVAVGGSTVFYAAVAMFVVGLSALVPAGIVLAFGFACLAQARKIRALLKMSRPTQ